MVKRIMHILGGLALALFLSVGINSSAGGRELPSQEATAVANISDDAVGGNSDTVEVFETPTPNSPSTVVPMETEMVTSTPTATLDPTALPFILASDVCVSYVPVGEGIRDFFSKYAVTVGTVRSANSVPICTGEGSQIDYYFGGIAPSCIPGVGDCTEVAIVAQPLSSTIHTTSKGTVNVSYRELLAKNPANLSRIENLLITKWLGMDGSIELATKSYALFMGTSSHGIGCSEFVYSFWVPESEETLLTQGVIYHNMYRMCDFVFK